MPPRCRSAPNEVARAIAAEARGAADRRSRIVRNGTRGMCLARAAGRSRDVRAAASATARCRPATSRSLFDADFLHGGAHALRLGPVEDDPVFREAGAADVRARRRHRSRQPRRLPGARRLPRPARARSRMSPADDRQGSDRLRPARARRRGVSDRHQVEDRARRAGRSEVRHLQRGRRRLGHVRRSHADGRRSVRASSRA